MTAKNKSKGIKIGGVVKPVVPNKQSNPWLPWICVAAIALVTYFVFSSSLDAAFTNWDDPVYVKDNPLVVNNSISLQQIFKTPVGANYHPLTILSLAMNYQNGKLDPFGYHLENVIFHVLNTILVFLFIFLLTRRNLLMASIVSLLFGIHPMHVESVTWVSERKDVMYVFFFLAGLISYLRYIETKKISWYLFTLLLFMLSCLSKGMAVVFPVILLLIDYLKGAPLKVKLLIEKIPFFLLSLVFGVIAVKIQSGSAIASMGVFSVFQRLMFVSYGAIMYIVKFFVPVKLSAFYPYPVTTAGGSVPPVFYLSPFILLAIIGALIYFFRKKEKEIVFGLLFYFTAVVLVLQFITVGFAIMADRYTYLSYIGLAFIVAYVINKLWHSSSSLKYPVVVIAIIAAVIFSYKTYSRTMVWQNSGTLWADVIEKYPRASVAYEHLAVYYNDNNDFKQALLNDNIAVQCDLNNRDAVYNRGLLYMDQFHKTNLAIADFTKAIELAPGSADAYNNRGSLYFEKGKVDSAFADITKAIALKPTYVQYYFNRGICYKTSSQFAKALPDFNKAIQLTAQPPAVYYYDRGICYAMLDSNSEAIADFSQAITLNPSNADYLKLRSFVENKIGQAEKANTDALKAQQLPK